ncbi:hypothetical protein [Brachyspira sp.]|uniref:hypothetical protein n=1 Tax=Brachyspira sp. TaxID=1977261 RepID=UPI002614F2D8|nr:hypothetical protein [Brachyspira sp.]
MKIVKNLIILILFFIVFFVIYFGIYCFKVLETNNISQNINFDLIKNLMEHYFFAIIIAAITSSLILIGSMNKLVGHLSAITAIGILSFFVTLYPAYIIVFDKNIDYLRNELNDRSSMYIDESGKYFTKVDNYLIKVGYKLLDNTYKNVILIDPPVLGKLYIADYIYITDKEISLHEVTEIYGVSKVEKASSLFERNSFINYISNFISDIIFGFEAFPVISALLKIITLANIPVFAIILIFFNIWFLFFSFYMLGLSLHSRQYIYHNILNAFLLYGIIKVIFAINVEHYNLVEIIIRNLNYWTMNLYTFMMSLTIIIVSLILKKVLNNDKKQQIIKEMEKEY